jgi:hypothetical protein
VLKVSQSFIYAGAESSMLGNNPVTAEDLEDALLFDEVYVLSIPAFTWFKADYPAQVSRGGHTCQVVGNRQMLSFGGVDPRSPAGDYSGDLFTVGIGIFDLTEMAWSSQYDAGAAPYKSPNVVASYYYSK